MCLDSMPDLIANIQSLNAGRPTHYERPRARNATRPCATIRVKDVTPSTMFGSRTIGARSAGVSVSELFPLGQMQDDSASRHASTADGDVRQRRVGILRIAIACGS